MQLKVVLLTSLLVWVPSPCMAGVPVELTGRSGADETLMHDITQSVTYYGAAFDCPAPSKIHASILDPGSIPSRASYKAPSPKASYEEWDADFCGKTYQFFVTFWPDPKGGSFLSVTYPYPDGAPHK